MGSCICANTAAGLFGRSRLIEKSTKSKAPNFKQIQRKKIQNFKPRFLNFLPFCCFEFVWHLVLDICAYASPIVTFSNTSPTLNLIHHIQPAGHLSEDGVLAISQSVTTWVMKNWLPLVLGPAFGHAQTAALMLFEIFPA